MSHSQQIIDHFTPTHHQSQIVSGKLSLSNNIQKSSHPPIPHNFFQPNLNGTQSLKHHQTPTRSLYPSTFTLQPNHLTSQKQNNDVPMNTSQQKNRTSYIVSSRSHMQFENPANV